MKHRYLAGWVVGLALTASVASVDCGGDDDAGTTAGTAGTAGKTGAGGSAGATVSGSGGKGGATSSTTSAGGGGSGGKAGGGGAGESGGSGGKAGGGGSSGTGGSGGQSDAGTDAKSDVATDAPRPDATGDGASTDAADVSVTPDGGADGSTSDGSSDAADGAVPFASVRQILTLKCTGCHRPRDAGAQLIDFLTDDGLYARLIAPLPDTQEGQCGFSDAGTDGGDGAAPENRRPIVPSDPGASFLYLKVAGTQPAGCGLRMPRRTLTLEDGGTTPVGCDGADGGAAANCLSQAELDTILHWIEQGAPNN